MHYSPIENPDVAVVFADYPESFRDSLMELRQMILDTAKEIEEIDSVEETLKWGEPSYLVKKGSTIRLDWKAKTPDQYAIYFKCTSKLVPSFREVFGDLFEYDGNRAIVFQLDDNVPEAELKQCIAAGLRYYKVKQIPLLGLG